MTHKGDPYTKAFSTISEIISCVASGTVNYSLQQTVFTQRNFVADFLQEKCEFRGKTPICVFEPPLGDLRATYDDHVRLVGKRVSDFLLVLIELFSLGRTVEALRAIIGSKSAISLQRGPVDPKFQVEGIAPHQPFFFSQN